MATRKRKPETTMKPVRMKLGQLEYRANLNPRQSVDQAAIQRYVRRLHNGEYPPPIEADVNTHIIFAGAHRFHAYRDFYGESWANREVEVLMRDNLPNPDTEPEMWRLMAANNNLSNGVPIKRADVERIMREIEEKRGEEAMRRYAALVGETEESLAEMFQRFAPAPIGERAQPVAATGGHVGVAPGRTGEFRSESAQPGHRRSSPSFIGDINTLRSKIEQYAETLTERERTHLLTLAQYIGEVCAEK